MIRFQYDMALLARFPTIRGGAIFVRGLRGGPTPPALAAAFQAEQAAVLARIGSTPLAELPTLSAWRSAYRAFGAEPTQYRCAAEALLRRLTKKGDIPGINLLVDLGNLISIRYAMPLAMFDLTHAAGTITVRFAQGDERFTELGSDEVKHPEPGEVIFVDDTGLIFARRWCWRQSAQSASTEATTDVLITLEGQHPGAEAEVRAGLADLRALLAEYAGGATVAADVLGPGNVAIEG
jgi:DNA/RNA-binding domain of Phe-tRNA-synthetase-like protein